MGSDPSNASIEEVKKMINSVIVNGHLGQDPEMKYNDDGNPIARFSIVCNEVWSTNGQKKVRLISSKCCCKKSESMVISFT